MITDSLWPRIATQIESDSAYLKLHLLPCMQMSKNQRDLELGPQGFGFGVSSSTQIKNGRICFIVPEDQRPRLHGFMLFGGGGRDRI